MEGVESHTTKQKQSDRVSNKLLSTVNRKSIDFAKDTNKTESQISKEK